MTKIEQGVPLPPQRKTGLTQALRRLNVGDSFLWPTDGVSGLHISSLRLGVTVVRRSVGNGMSRVWRTK